MKPTLPEAFPEIAKEWDDEKNSKPASAFYPSSGKKAFWRCPEGHSYETPIEKRTRRGDGCPFCSGRRVLKGFNDLATTNPELIDEWDYERNPDILPTEITARSNKKVWWRCRDCGHEWEAPISNRSRCSGCPNCRYKKSIPKRLKTVLQKQGSLAKNYPELIEEWDFEKNKEIADPEAVAPKSTIKVHWKCKHCGNEWISPIQNRVRGSGCLKCSYKIRQMSNRKN